MDNTYLTLKYNTKSRWLGYWHQISEALEISPDNILLIGKGSGVTENSIRLMSKGKVNILTLDINNSVAPDTVGEAVNLPFKNEAFDVSLCCQVLEHLPFQLFSTALNELKRVTRKRVILSLPHGRKHIRIACNMPFLGEKNLIIKNPLTKKHCISKKHCWEIGRSVSYRQVINQITKFFEIDKEFLNEINCSHRFFILKRKNI
jgi:ubiquinone/menaquinone biosynthesis C-methylase UbiE